MRLDGELFEAVEDVLGHRALQLLLLGFEVAHVAELFEFLDDRLLAFLEQVAAGDAVANPAEQGKEVLAEVVGRDQAVFRGHGLGEHLRLALVGLDGLFGLGVEYRGVDGPVEQFGQELRQAHWRAARDRAAFPGERRDDVGEPLDFGVVAFAPGLGRLDFVNVGDVELEVGEGRVELAGELALELEALGGLVDLLEVDSVEVGEDELVENEDVFEVAGHPGQGLEQLGREEFAVEVGLLGGAGEGREDRLAELRKAAHEHEVVEEALQQGHLIRRQTTEDLVIGLVERDGEDLVQRLLHVFLEVLNDGLVDRLGLAVFRQVVDFLEERGHSVNAVHGERGVLDGLDEIRDFGNLHGPVAFRWHLRAISGHIGRLGDTADLLQQVRDLDLEGEGGVLGHGFLLADHRVKVLLNGVFVLADLLVDVVEEDRRGVGERVFEELDDPVVEVLSGMADDVFVTNLNQLFVLEDERNLGNSETGFHDLFGGLASGNGSENNDKAYQALEKERELHCFIKLRFIT